MRISYWSSDVGSSDLHRFGGTDQQRRLVRAMRQQPRPRHRGKGRRDLELWVIGAAGALPRLGPGMVKDIFALAVRLEIGGRRGDQHAVPILDQQRRRLPAGARSRSEEHTSELQSLMRISYAVFCLK